MRGFADQQVGTGARSRAEADAYAAEQLASLLPEGVSTPGHHLWELHDDGALAGHLWLAVGERAGFLYDIELLPEARGRGLGRASMLAAEDAARDLGADVLTLSVFGPNTVARHLYERLGYDVRSAVHTRLLDAAADPAAPSTPEADGLVLARPAQVTPGHEVWTAARDGHQAASACLHWSRTGAGRRVDAHDLRAPVEGDRVALLRALVGLARGRGAVAVAAETAEEGWSRALRTAGFALTAELREKRLVHDSGGAAR